MPDKHFDSLVAVLIEDDPDSATLIEKILADLGFAVSVFSDGVEGLSHLDKNSVDLLVTDFELPGKNGLEICRQLRGSGAADATYIVVLTAHGDEQRMVDVLDAGADDYLQKQIGPKQLKLRLRVIRSQVETLRERVNIEQQLRISEERYALAAKGANDGLWDWDIDSGRVYYSPRWYDMVGVDPVELDNPESMDTWLGRVHPLDSARVKGQLEAHRIGAVEKFEVEHRVRGRSDEYFWALVRGLAKRDSAGRAIRVAGSLTDVTEMGMSDPLTGLPNRRLIVDRLGLAIRRNLRNEHQNYGLLFVDLDNFKLVNDSLGHGAGDLLLIELGRRMESILRPSDSIARIGGDEFLVLIEELDNMAELTRVAERLRSKVRKPILIEDHEVVPKVSIGIASSQIRYRTQDEVLRDADTALYRAKEQGRDRIVVFDSSMHAEVTARLELEADIRRAINDDEFVVYYQPVMDQAGLNVVSFEALVRWHHPGFGLRFPAEFIPVAEETGMILQLGEFVISEACRQLVEWTEADPVFANCTMSVNVSPRLFKDTDLAGDIAGIIKETGIEPSRLHIEITESIMMDDPPHSRQVLTELSRLGAKISLDDFGTGYSSLSYLHEFPIDTLKIDRVFVSRMVNDERSREIIRSVVLLAENLGLGTIAEGVETVEEFELLQQYRCNGLQGFLFAHALPAELAYGFARDPQNEDVLSQARDYVPPVDRHGRHLEEGDESSRVAWGKTVAASQKVIEYLESHAGSGAQSAELRRVLVEDEPELFDFTASIELSGEKNGVLFLTIERSLLASLLPKVLPGVPASDAVYRELVGEMCNLAAGNAVGIMNVANLTISPPKVYEDAAGANSRLDGIASFQIAEFQWNGFVFRNGIGWLN